MVPSTRTVDCFVDSFVQILLIPFQNSQNAILNRVFCLASVPTGCGKIAEFPVIRGIESF
jgi:hypothetical protein